MANRARKLLGIAIGISLAVWGPGTLLPGRQGLVVHAAATLLPPALPALPPPVELIADPLLDAQLQDLEDKPVSLRAMRGKVVVVLHQDRHSSEQNPTFKDRLGELVLRHQDRIQLVALAEVGGYNFWPARRYVKDALRPLRALGGALVACDWKAAVQKKYRIPAKQSAVFVVGKDGTLQVLLTGVLPASRAAELLSQIEKLALD